MDAPKSQNLIEMSVVIQLYYGGAADKFTLMTVYFFTSF